MSKDARQRTLDLFANRHNPARDHPELEWPDPLRFPLNLDGTDVAQIVHVDLKGAHDRLIVTGYAALDQLIDFVSDCDTPRPIRILFGWEPFRSRRKTFEVDGENFPGEVEAYWLDEGIFLRLSAKVVRCIEILEGGQLDSRYLGKSRCRLHAKIYCTERAATVGSSNFTRRGLFGQLEANARFTSASDPARHRDLRTIAENYWHMGTAYNEQLIALLRKLLHIVEWREALARACAELLEGEWAHGPGHCWTIT